MRKEYLFIAILILLAGLLFGFGSRGAYAVQQALRGSTPSIDGHDLAASIGSVLGTDSAVHGKTVAVYSQYPLNLKQELTIAAGAKDGLAVGDIALTDGFFVGVVSKTSDHAAVVQTIFDSRFQAPVRIGATGTDALLRGGNNPMLTLIPASGIVGEDDRVYSAASGVPYGTPLGTLRGLHDATDKVFREASLAAPYNPGTLEELTIVPSSRP